MNRQNRTSNERTGVEFDPGMHVLLVIVESNGKALLLYAARNIRVADATKLQVDTVCEQQPR